MSWSTVKLADLATVSSGGGAPQDADAFSAEGVPFVRAGSLVKLLDGEPEESLELLQPDVAADHRLKLFPAGTVLFAKSGMSATKGHVYQLKKPAYLVNHLAALIPRSEVSGRYLRQVLKFKSPTCLIKDEAYPSIRLGDIESMEVPAPKSESERERIAAILDEADELCRKRQRALDRLNQLGQAIFIEMFGDPQTNPLGLPQCVLGDVVHSASDGPHVSPAYADSGIPFLSTRHVKPGEILWRDLKYLTVEDAEAQWKKCRPQIGDLLYTKGGTTGIAAVVDTEKPFAVWVHVALLKTNHAKVLPLWLETMLNCDFCYRQSQTLTHGIANRDLGLKRMVNIKMYLPSLADQRKFVERLQVVRAMRSNMRLAEEAGQSFFASLQHRAFSGELTASSLKEAAA